MCTWPVLLLFLGAVAVWGWSRTRESTPDVVLDCSSTAGREILKISPATLKVQNLSLTPTRSGHVKITDGEYRLEFTDLPVFTLLFRINRYTGEGTRELVDSSGKVSPRDFFSVSCKPYAGSPL